MKKFFKEFKAFICRGNIMDLAVAVIIGGAFSAIVTAFANKIIMPVVNYILSLGSEDGLSSAYTYLKKVTLEDGTIDKENSIFIDWGAFITAVIDFLIIALVIFIMIKIIMNVSNNAKKIAEKSKHELTSKQRKELKKQGLTKEEIKQKETEAYETRIAKEAAEKAAAKAETSEALLKEIRDLLAAQNKTSKKDK